MPLRIELAKSVGFCFGVRRAINIAMNAASGPCRVYMLGDIVHNEEVIKGIKKMGIKKISRMQKGRGRHCALLIRAHGCAKSILEEARSLGYQIIDATCPMVKEIHRIARDSEGQGRRIIIIGDKEHDEVKGISGQLKHPAIIIDSLKTMPLKRIKNLKKAAVVVQSTQNIEKVRRILKIIFPLVKDIVFHNTICQPTTIKQEEIKVLPQKNDCMLIIGSKNSANTRRLYEISRALNKKSYRVNSKDDIKAEWFKKCGSVGVTAGASTPDQTIQEVIRYLKRL